MAAGKPRFTSVLPGKSAGSAAIEFGLAVPLLAILVIGVIEAGFSVYQAMQVTYAAEAGLFYAAKNGWNQTGIANAAQTATTLSGMSVSASQYCGCPGATGITAAICGATCGSGYQASQYIQISVSLTRRSIIPNSGLPLPSTVSAQSILRQN
jgi:Flp pilus assembly protein TadG